MPFVEGYLEDAELKAASHRIPHGKESGHDKHCRNEHPLSPFFDRQFILRPADSAIQAYQPHELPREQVKRAGRAQRNRKSEGSSAKIVKRLAKSELSR